MSAAASAVTLPGRPNFPSDLRVVLVDAVAEQSEILDQLQALNYTVDAFESASDAAAFFERDSATPDVVLAEADLVQQGEEGASDLLLHIHDQGVQLVLMKSCAEPEDVMKGIESGAADFLQKPISTHRLRNIWQHVVRKLMATGDIEDMSSGGQPPGVADSCQMVLSCDDVVEVDTNCVSEAAAIPKGDHAPADSATAAAESDNQPQGHSGNTSHGSRSLDADASSSVTESARGGRSRTQRLRSDSGKAAGRAVGSRTPRSRRAKSYNKASSQGGTAASAAPPLLLSESSFQLPPPIALPTVPWHQQVPDVWSTTPVGVHSLGASKWQQMPAAFMPVGSTEAAAPTASPKRNRRGKGKPSSSVPLPKTLGSTSFLSTDSFGSSSTFELDASLLDLGKLEGCNQALGGSSPCFGGSHDSLDSDFTDLMIPNDLDLDLMFGDDLEAPGLWADNALPAGTSPSPSGARDTTPLAPEVPPIGLSLRKSQSLVNLINRHLAAAIGASIGTGAADAHAPVDQMHS